MADFTTNTWTSTSGVHTLAAKTVDTILHYSPATLFFLGNQKKWSGTAMKFPIKYVKSTEGTAFDGLEKFSTSKTTQYANFSFNPTGREIPVVVSQFEVDVNKSNPTQDLVARAMSSAAQDMAEDISTAFYTLQTGKEFYSLTDACDDGRSLNSAFVKSGYMLETPSIQQYAFA